MTHPESKIMETQNAFESAFITSNTKDHLGYPKNLADGLFTLAEVMEEHTKRLCIGDVYGPSALEYLALRVKECGESIAGGLYAIADAITNKK